MFLLQGKVIVIKIVVRAIRCSIVTAGVVVTCFQDSYPLDHAEKNVIWLFYVIILHPKHDVAKHL